MSQCNEFFSNYDVLVEIFSWLSLPKLLKMGQVSKFWYELVYDDILMSKIYIIGGKIEFSHNRIDFPECWIKAVDYKIKDFPVKLLRSCPNLIEFIFEEINDDYSYYSHFTNQLNFINNY